jgi:hypothetical protein
VVTIDKIGSEREPERLVDPHVGVAQMALATDIEMPSSTMISALDRDTLVAQITSSTSSILSIVGDTGVGKSEVLDQSLRNLPPKVIAGSSTIAYSPAALQLSVLNVLANLVSEVIESESIADQFEGILAQTIERMAETSMRDLGCAVARHLVGIVRTRVSAEAADALVKVVSNISEAPSHELASRISQASSPDVFHLVLDLAESVRELLSADTIVIGLDNCERLDENDQRRLLDYSISPRPGIAIRMVIGTWSPENVKLVRQFESAGIKSIPVEPLTEDEIITWLESENLNSSAAPVIMRITNGYPIYAKSALELIQSGSPITSLESMQPTEPLGAQMSKTWSTLTPYAKVASTLLAAFRTPLPDRDIADHLGMSLESWFAIRHELSACSYFTGSSLWFHELRRRYLWSTILSEEERANAINRATEFWNRQFGDPPPPPEAFVEYARILSLDSAEIDSMPQVAAVLSCDKTELSILGACIELMTPDRQPFHLEHLMMYAQQVFGGSDLIFVALGQLVTRGLVSFQSNEYSSQISFIEGTEVEMRVMQGRIAALCYRFPIPEVSTVLFNESLRDPSGAFRIGSIGIGHPSTTVMSREAHGYELRALNANQQSDYLPASVLVRLSWGSVPLYATMTYDNAEERDRAASELRGFEVSARGCQLKTVDVVLHPAQQVHSYRFARVVAEFTGQSVSNVINGSFVNSVSLAPLSVEEELTVRSDLMGSIWELSSEIERHAYRLEQPIGFAYRVLGEACVIAEIIGRGGAFEVQSLGPDFMDEFARPMIVNELGLRYPESVGRIESRSGRKSGQLVKDVVGLLAERASEFNKQQDQFIVSNDPILIRTLIEASYSQLVSDCEALSPLLARVFPDIEPEPFSGYHIKLVLVYGDDDRGFPYSAPWVYCGKRKLIDETSWVEVEAVNRAELDGRPYEDSSFWESHFKAGDESFETIIQGDASQIIAGLLGFKDSELSVRTV